MLTTHLRASLAKAAAALAIVFVMQLPGDATTVITDPSYNLNVTGNGHQTLRAPGTLSNAFASVTAGGAPSPNIHAQATDSNVYSSAGAIIDYYLEYVGPTGVLPVDINYELAYSGDFLHFGFISSTIEFIGAADVVAEIDNSTGVPVQDVKGTINQTVNANTVYEVILSVGTQAVPSIQGLTSTAMADPVISIDPSFGGDPGTYSLVLSSGIGNTAGSTPEPGTLLLAGTAFLVFLAVSQIRPRRGPKSALRP